MCEKKKIVKKTKSFRDNRRLTESEALIYPVGIMSAQSVTTEMWLIQALGTLNHHGINERIEIGL